MILKWKYIIYKESRYNNMRLTSSEAELIEQIFRLCKSLLKFANGEQDEEMLNKLTADFSSLYCSRLYNKKKYRRIKRLGVTINYPFTIDQLSDYNFITKYCIDHLVNGSAAYNDYIKYDEFIVK